MCFFRHLINKKDCNSKGRKINTEIYQGSGIKAEVNQGRNIKAAIYLGGNIKTSIGGDKGSDIKANI